MFKYNIGIIGGSTADEFYCNIAYKVGYLLAKNGCAVFCGGKTGVMECASHGVYDAGGFVAGFMPEYTKNGGNKYLSLVIPTGIGYLRNFLIIRASDALIAIDGKSGTTSEAAFALTEGKSVISIGNLNIDVKEGDGKLIRVKTPEEAVERAMDEAWKYTSKFGEK
ncbi:TIGR00725 family protein [Acidiplasma sp.]|uniref:TIGR00725 family protein n=1 Tax=Acidiplasma sp. TaxID=1872114 RepID=UPI00258840CB|nr:TIGR00725 family protein [Acidiplasma sp.]